MYFDCLTIVFYTFMIAVFVTMIMYIHSNTIDNIQCVLFIDVYNWLGMQTPLF